MGFGAEAVHRGPLAVSGIEPRDVVVALPG
jgi:hypothetical protein